MFDNQQIMHLNLHNGQILRKIDLCNGQSSKAFTNRLQSVTGCELVTICYQLMWFFPRFIATKAASFIGAVGLGILQGMAAANDNDDDY